MQAQSTHNAGFYFAYWPSFFSISLPPFEYIQITLVSALWCKTIFIICLICVQTEFTKRTLQLRHTKKKYTHGKRERDRILLTAIRNYAFIQYYPSTQNPPNEWIKRTQWIEPAHKIPTRLSHHHHYSNIAVAQHMQHHFSF